MNKSSATPGFLLLLAGSASLLLALIIAPFAGSLFAAAVLAGALHPGQAWLEKRLGDRPTPAAGVLTLGLTGTVVAPLAGLCVFVAHEIRALYGDLASILKEEGVDGLVRRVPGPLQDAARDAIGLLSQDVARSPAAQAGEAKPDASDSTTAMQLTSGDLETAAAIATDVFDALIGLLMDLGVLIVALFFLLSQGTRLVAWIEDVLPLTDKQTTRLIEEFRDVTRAVFAATVATAFLQTLVAALGYWIAGIPYLPIALLITFVAALIPVVGAAMVVGGIGVLLLLYGEVGYGLFLVAWGVLPVGVCDNVAKPWIARGKLRLPGSVVLFAMLGGVAVFGPMGIVAGPLIVAFFLAALRLLRQEGLMAT